MSRRLDVWLVENGCFGGRDTAKQHIAAGEIRVNGRTVTKPATPISDTDTVVCAAREKYVGRGGYKLEKALAAAAITPAGCVALDVGASTGGFTDCMLKNGAAHVYAVDVGHSQLHESLRRDKRVISLENTDIRSPHLKEQLTLPPTFCSVDVSFISLKQVLPSVLALLAPNATLVCLIKPQFEAGRQSVGKGGVVKDKATHTAVLCDLCRTFAEWGCGVKCLTYSPIRGGEGNVEYLAVLQPNSPDNVVVDIPALVREAFSNL